jgi:putative transposase
MDLYGTDIAIEFISPDLDLRAYQRNVILDFSLPGNPMDNVYADSFNGKFRAGRLNHRWFLTLDGVRR